MDNSQIEAVGAVLSQKNTSQIKQAWIALTELLVASGNLAYSDLPKELISAQSVYDARKKEISAAGRLAEVVNLDTWHQTLRNLADHFCGMFSSAVYSEAGKKDELVSELTSDFLAVIQTLAKNAPNPESRFLGNRLYASADQNAEPVVQVAPEVQTEQKLEPEPVSALEKLFQQSIAQEEAIQAAEEQLILPLLQEEGTVTLQIEAKARFDTSATNERVVEGILFKIDSPSEAIPNVGPGLPLYIPRSVALEALAGLDLTRPKPLDAHNSLSQHASTEIVGAMTSARIDGNDFWVTGVLWDYNQPEKVEAISASQDNLGMSVNATAEGHPTEINGRSVWQIDRLRILGANILFAEKATFKQTRTSVMASSEFGELIPVLASASESDLESDLEENPTPENSETMDTQAIVDQIRELSSSVSNMHTEVKNRLNTLEPTVQQLAAQMSEIQAAAQEAKNQELQAAQAENKQQEQAQLLQSLTSLIEEKLAAIAPATRGALKYPSKVLPLAASGTPVASGATAIQLELAAIGGEIRAIEQNPHMECSKWFELIDKRKSLEYQLGQSAQ
ncbi:hypothetical protein QT972_15780 [Microcoleus sp. herbarium7]|uniref:hypothetical protein n=1 Tax=Microcoleus sp. herbarium7 TaxID=3055435 RepID=UPI002FD3245E